VLLLGLVDGRETEFGSYGNILILLEDYIMEEEVGTDIADWFIPIEAWLKVSFDF
jgi:hypothetical protein